MESHSGSSSLYRLITTVTMGNYYDHVKPILVSVDCIVFGFENGKLKILIGKRKMNPGKGEWSLYGDFVAEDETLEDAARRTLKTLTGLDNQFLRQTGTYGDINRDPGKRVISVAYCSLINVSDYSKTLIEEYGVEWVTHQTMPTLYSDHNKMVDDAIRQLRHNIVNEPLCFKLLPELFTLTQLQQVYEAIFGNTIDKRNFRKRIKSMPYIEMTDKIDKQTSKRGATLYRFNEEIYRMIDEFD